MVIRYPGLSVQTIVARWQTQEGEEMDDAENSDLKTWCSCFFSKYSKINLQHTACEFINNYVCSQYHQSTDSSSMRIYT